MADIKSEHYAYPTKKIACPNCGWTGLGKETTKEFDEHPGGMPYYCPKCKSFLERVTWPTDEETLKYGPKKDQEEVKQSNIRMARLRKKWDATKLKSIKQLPEVAGDALEFIVKETKDEDNDTLITITCRDQFIWKEYVYYEYYERFIAIGEMLKAKYEERMTDFVPDDSVELYGDCLSAPKQVEEFCAGLRTTIPDLEKAIQKKPNDEQLHYNLGLSYGKKGEEDKAIEYFTEAIELEPEYVAAYFSRGFSYQLKGEWDKAIADYSKVIKITPKDASAFSYRGNALKGKGEYVKALKDYTTSIKVDPKYSLVHYDLGNLQAMTGKRAEAIISFEKYLVMQPTDDDHMIAWAFYSIACIHALEGRKKEALDFFKQALEKGLRELRHINEDTDLDQLRNDPQFIKLMAKHFPAVK